MSPVVIRHTDRRYRLKIAPASKFAIVFTCVAVQRRIMGRLKRSGSRPSQLAGDINALL